MRLTAVEEGADRSDEAVPAVRALVVLEHEILEGFIEDGRSQRVARRRLMTVWIDPEGGIANAGSVPWLDFGIPGETEIDRARRVIDEAWGDTQLETNAVAYVAQHIAPEHYAEVEQRRTE